MSAAAIPDPRLYRGAVMHMRLQPFAHQFRYGVTTALLDLDRLDETAARLRWFSLDRLNLVAFHHRDHGPRDGGALRPWAEARLAAAGLPRPARLLLLSMPRVLGYAFNPLSVYFGYDAAGRLESLIYQVKNTFGDQHVYVLPAEVEADGAVRHGQDKEFFVSPFIGMDQRYRFTVRPPGDRLSVRIKQADAKGDYLIATQNGDAAPLDDAGLLRLAVATPWATLKVIAAIHWQALRLFLKGAKFLGYPGEDRAVVRRSGPPETTSGSAS